MAERAAHLVDHVLPADVPVRQWVLSVPHRLRYRLAYDHRLCRTVLHVFVRALRSAYRRQARRQGLSGGETGTVTSVQRFGGREEHARGLVDPPLSVVATSALPRAAANADRPAMVRRRRWSGFWQLARVLSDTSIR